MRVAVQIPIKARTSTRVPNKNFRDLCGKPLCCWLLDELVRCAPPEWDLYVDSEHESVMDMLGARYGDRLKFHQRLPWFAGDQANGNHLIHQFALQHHEYDAYLQVFVTAVTLKGEILMESVTQFLNCLDQYDSMFLVTEEPGWIWYQGKAINYDPHRPDGLPRSQDAMYLLETTGLYAITRDAVFRTGCRIGNKPLLYPVEPQYALDIDTMADLQEAERILGIK
ncbi:MAG: hypothetical protein Q7P63_13535 [Verrucomicrobiota bacterium JB022]|nr:hypothetical protein [Verrucomicrobiota bacterium JB022]